MPVVPSHPFVQDELDMFGGYTTVEFAEIPLHGAPGRLNVVRASKTSLAVVPGLVPKTQPGKAIVATSTVGDHQTGSLHVQLQESFQRVLLGVSNDLEFETLGVSLNGTYHNGLAAKPPFTKPGLIYLHDTTQCLSWIVWWYQCPEAPVPPTYSGVAKPCGQPGTAWTLALLPVVQQQKDLLVAELTAPEPGVSLGAYLLPTDFAPAVLSGSFPGNTSGTGLAAWCILFVLVGKHLVHQLLTPRFPR